MILKKFTYKIRFLCDNFVYIRINVYDIKPMIDDNKITVQ